MKTQRDSLAIPSKNILRVALITMFILMIPLVAMQYSEEWDWRLPDFIIIGALLFGSGMVYELLANKAHSAKHRIMIGLAVLAVVIIIWAELAVGIFD